MNALVAAFVAVAAVFAAPFELTDHVLHKDKLAVFHHAGVVGGHGAAAHRLRFVHLVPKVDHLGAFVDGVGCAATGHALKVHTKLDGGEHLVELLGLADCKTWHAVVVGAWDHHRGLFHKLHGVVKGEPVKVFGLFDELVDFVHVHLDGDHVKLFGKLLEKGLPAHVFTHKLHAKLAHALRLHA